MSIEMAVCTNLFIALVFLSFVSPAFALENSEEATGITPETLRLSIRYPMKLVGNSQQFSLHDLNLNSELTSDINEMIGYKSKGKAFIFSFLLPGAGEYYVGSKNLAKAFFITEITFWAGYFGFESYYKWKRDDMYSFAANHADANPKGKPAQYFVDIENYNNIYDYNDAKQLQREFYKVYPVNDEYYWSWDNEKNRKEFESMRVSSDRAHNRAIFTIGGIIANHLVSAIDAVWLSHRHNKRLDTDESAHLRFKISPGGVYSMSLQKSF